MQHFPLYFFIAVCGIDCIVGREREHVCTTAYVLSLNESRLRCCNQWKLFFKKLKRIGSVIEVRAFDSIIVKRQPISYNRDLITYIERSHSLWAYSKLPIATMISGRVNIYLETDWGSVGFSIFMRINFEKKWGIWKQKSVDKICIFYFYKILPIYSYY